MPTSLQIDATTCALKYTTAVQNVKLLPHPHHSKFTPPHVYCSYTTAGQNIRQGPRSHLFNLTPECGH